MENTSALGTFGKKAIAWIVLVAAALLALKLVFSAVMGFITMLVTIALVVGAVMAVMWALRRL